MKHHRAIRSMLRQHRKRNAVRSVAEANALVGPRLKALRKHHELSQTELGDLLGVTFQQIQKYEKSKSRVSAGMLYRLSTLLGVKMEDFFS